MPNPTLSADALRDLQAKIDELLRGELGGAYDCTRVWEAWSVGTMTDEDFEPVADRVDSIVLDIMSIVSAHTASAAGEVEKLRAEIDEALQLTESCSSLKQLAAACIEGAALKLEVEKLRAEVAALYTAVRKIQRTKVVGPSELHRRPAELRAWEKARYGTAKEIAEMVRALSASTLPRPASGPADAVAWLCVDRIMETRQTITDRHHAELRMKHPVDWEVIPLYAARPAAGSTEGE